MTNRISKTKRWFSVILRGNIFSLWESRAFRPGEGNAVCEMFQFSSQKNPTRPLLRPTFLQGGNVGIQNTKQPGTGFRF
jgi:hypothetical protein